MQEEKECKKQQSSDSEESSLKGGCLNVDRSRSEQLYEELSECIDMIPKSKVRQCVLALAQLQKEEGKSDAEIKHTFLKFGVKPPRDLSKKIKKRKQQLEYITNTFQDAYKIAYNVYVVREQDKAAFEKALKKCSIRVRKK